MKKQNKKNKMQIESSSLWIINIISKSWKHENGGENEVMNKIANQLQSQCKSVKKNEKPNKSP